ncbi:MAG: collagen-like protein, partial [Clostridia bacterium]|nr:collagen-like protein [Clostridia bacterium]
NIKGEQGQQGANGSSFLTNEGAPAETYGANGDVCLDTTTYDLYKKIDGTWSKIGNIKGAQGESGAQGDAGTSSTTWLSGAGEPALGIGAEGDFYLDTETCNIYIKGESGWAVAVNIKGEQGVQGETGATGEQGATGSTGVAGKDGATWLHGATTPDNANGNNGDFYLDTATCNIYVKSSNVWELLCNIKGADGASGDSGSTTTSTIEIVDGNWVINGEDTGIKAEGEAGTNGKSAYELYKEENPDYTGTLSEWLESLKGDAGNDGLTPYIKDGYWWIGDTNTEVSATPNTKITLTSDGQLSINGTIVDVDSNLTYENLKIVLDGYEIKKEVSASGKWAEGGSVEFNEAGYINSSGQVVTGNTWIHTDFIPLNRLNGSIGQFVGHAVVAHVAYYSGNSFTDFVSSKNLSEFTGSVNDGYITYNTVLDNAPENAEYVVFSTNSANYSLTVDLTPSAESTLIYTISPKTDKDVIVGDRLMHFSFDDTIASLKDLTDNASTYTSIFDSPFFGALKEVHDEYGAVFSCYCFYEYDVDGSTETTDDTFTLADCTDAFASEFAANADWLRFGFHSRNENTTYGATDVTAETALTDYNDTITQLLRITGSVKCIDTCIRTQSFTGNKEVCLALRDADCGVIGFLTGDYTETGENPNIDTSTGYYLSSEAAALCGKKGRYFDYENQLFFFPSNKRLDNMGSADVTAYLELFNTADRYNRSHMMEMYAHENQMIKNITDYKLRLKYTAEWAVENGYEFGFTMDKINQMF